MEEQRVTLTNVDIPFGRMVVIILKWTLASIPALILMWLVAGFIMLVFVAGTGALMSR